MKPLLVLGAAAALLFVMLLAPFGLLTASSGPAVAVSPCVVGSVDAAPEGRWDTEQTTNAATIVAVGKAMAVPPRGWLVALATAMQESGLRNLSYGDRDSLGLFQQRPSQGWGTAALILDPEHASRSFYEHLLALPDWQRVSVTEAAQAVQRSAFPLAYAKWEPAAQALLDSLAGKVDTGCPAPAPGEWTAPLAPGYRLSAGFGAAGGLWERDHTGLDMAAPTGTAIYAASTGVIISAGPGGPYGLLVKVAHADAETWYAHMSATTATPGAPVTPGQPIGEVGSSGNTTGPHLHLEVRINGIPVDPTPFFAARNVTL